MEAGWIGFKATYPRYYCQRTIRLGGRLGEISIESSGPIAIPINVLELGEDGDDRGDGGRVAVVDDQSRSRRPPHSCPRQNPRDYRPDGRGSPVTLAESRLSVLANLLLCLTLLREGCARIV